MRFPAAAAAALAAATPAAAASGPFFSLGNSDFVVLIAFLGFVGILVYFKVHDMIGGLLDRRAEAIREELDTARSLREEAKDLLGSFERRARDARAQAERIIATARDDALAAAEAARAEIDRNIERRLRAAEEQIAAAEADAIRAIREQAVGVAVAAAGDVLARQMTARKTAASIEAAIEDVAARLH